MRRSRASIAEILADYDQSGLTQVAFVRERGLKLSTFRRWLAQRREGPAAGLCAVTLRQEANERLTIRLPGGIEVACEEVDPQWVIALVRGLNQ